MENITPIWEKEILTAWELAQLIPDGENKIRKLCAEKKIKNYKNGPEYCIPKASALEYFNNLAENFEGHSGERRKAKREYRK